MYSYTVSLLHDLVFKQILPAHCYRNLLFAETVAKASMKMFAEKGSPRVSVQTKPSKFNLIKDTATSAEAVF